MRGWGGRSTIVPAIAIAASIIFAIPGLAEESAPATPKRIRVDVGIGTWISVGDTRWSHNASSVPPLGNPTSKLIYADHSTNVVELTAKVSVGPRWFGRLNIGGANIGGGRLTDDDFLTPDGGSPSLRTHSDIHGGGMWYVNADVGSRLLNYPNGRGTLDGFVGFQYWRQEHKGFGVRQVICTNAGATDFGDGRLCNPAATPISNSVLAISNISTWYSVRTGLQTEYRLTRWLSLQGSAALKPLSIFQNEDTHHLRQDVFQSPSFTMFGIGIGADADIGAKVYFSKEVSLSLGYRVWWNRMLDGTWKNHLTDGSSSSFPLTEFQSIRHGFTAGLNFAF